MEENGDRSPATERWLVVPPTEASLRLQVTDLLLGRPRDVRKDREHSDVLQQIEGTLEVYGNYFYPPERC
jgi:hypothetical protein